jgi:hypothetical protein
LASAQQRSDGREVFLLMTDMKHELLAHDDGVRIAAIGIFTRDAVRAVVGPGGKVFAVLLESFLASRAL